MDVHPPKYGTIGFDPWPYFSTAQDESDDRRHGHFVPQNTVLFDVRTCGGGGHGPKEGLPATPPFPL